MRDRDKTREQLIEELEALRRRLSQSEDRPRHIAPCSGSTGSGEEPYRQLFENMTEGFAIGEPILDGNGVSRDFHFIEINDAFERQSGLTREILGKPMSQVLPFLENHWIETYCGVALTGNPVRFENYNKDLDKHFHVYCYSPEKGRFAILFWDATDRKRAEEWKERRIAGLNALIEVGAHVLQSQSMQELLDKVVDAARMLTGAKVGTSGHGYREGHFRVGATSKSEDSLPCPPGSVFAVERGGVYLDLIESTESMRLSDKALPAHPRWWGLPEGHTPLRGLLGVRLADSSGQAKGLIMVSQKEEGDFTQEDELLLKQLASIASIGLQHLEAREALLTAYEELEDRVRDRTAELIHANQILQLDEARFEALYRLSRMGEASRKEIADFALEHLVTLTRSKMAWVGFMNTDESATLVHSWSRTAMEECSIMDKPMHFPVEKGGIWAECIRERKTVVINDYNAAHEAKRGCPRGHVELRRLLCVPVLDGGRIVVVGVVGNKEEDYDSSDMRQMWLLLDGMWKHVKQKEAGEELRAYTRKLQESNQTLQDFASIASHDLQEPLRKVNSFGHMLNDQYGGSLGERGKDYLNRMLSATRRMQTLLEALLNYSRVNTRVEPFTSVRVGDLIREVLSDLEVRTAQTGGRVEVGDLPTIEADPTQMRQLFQNLIGNALKFHKQGEKPVVRVSAHNENDHHIIRVEDNGIGFEEQYLDKIFAPFQRLHGRSSSYEGTGMGLAICKKIIERHGGSITASSVPGEGSLFIINLPVRRSGLEAPKPGKEGA